MARRVSRHGRRSLSLAHPWGIKRKQGEDPAATKPSWSCSSSTHRAAKPPTKAALEQAELVQHRASLYVGAQPLRHQQEDPKIFVKRRRLRVKASAVCNHRQLLLLTSLQQQRGGFTQEKGVLCLTPDTLQELKAKRPPPRTGILGCADPLGTGRGAGAPVFHHPGSEPGRTPAPGTRGSTAPGHTCPAVQEPRLTPDLFLPHTSIHYWAGRWGRYSREKPAPLRPGGPGGHPAGSSAPTAAAGEGCWGHAATPGPALALAIGAFGRL